MGIGAGSNGSDYSSEACPAHLQDTVFKLSANGMTCAALSGEMQKEERQNTLRRFQKGDYRALIVRCNPKHLYHSAHLLHLLPLIASAVGIMHHPLLRLPGSTSVPAI